MMKHLTLIICLLPLLCHSAIILRTKGKIALIHLEGLHVSKGSFLESYNLNGKPAGLMQIKRVGDVKAIGILRLGTMNARWSLEPKSRNWAISQLQHNKKRKQALAQKKMQRRLASKNTRQRRQRASSRSRNNNRNVSNFSEGEEYVLDDNEMFSKQDYSNQESNATYGSAVKDIPFTVGINLEGTFNYMKLTPPRSYQKDAFTIKGIGFGGSVFSDIDFHKNISAKFLLGYRRFNAKNSDDCAGVNSCHLQIGYALGGAGLKFNYSVNNNVGIIAGFNGKLLYPIEHIVTTGLLDRKSFNGVHGTLGLQAGFEFTFDGFKIPFALGFDLVNPPTETTLTWMLGASLGFGYQF